MDIKSPKKNQRLLTLTPTEEAWLARVEAVYGPNVIGELIGRYLSERNDHLDRQDIENMVKAKAQGSPLAAQIDTLAAQVKLAQQK